MPEIHLPEIPEVQYSIRYYRDGEWVHDREVDYFDVENSFEVHEVIEENTPKRDDYTEIEVVQKELLGYQVRCYDGSELKEVYVVTLTPFMKFKETKFKLALFD